MSFYPPSYFLLLSTEHPDWGGIYLGQESSFMYMTPRRRRLTEGRWGRWWTMPSRDVMLSSSLIPPLYWFLIVWLMYHGNSVWMQKVRERRLRLEKVGPESVSCFFFFFILISAQILQLLVVSYFVSFFSPSASFSFWVYSNNPHLQLIPRNAHPKQRLPSLCSSSLI